jgi:endonuclease-3 related protein
MTSAAIEEQIRTYYSALYDAWGAQHWWPARTRFEVIVGAYLTQNTSWKNVEIALRRLRATGSLNLRAIRKMPFEQIEAMIRPAGYFRQKAARLKTFVAFVDQYYGGSLRRLFAQPDLRPKDRHRGRINHCHPKEGIPAYHPAFDRRND